MMTLVAVICLVLSSAVAAAEWWKPQPGLSYQYQLSGALDASQDVQVHVVDLFGRTKDDIAALHTRGAAVLCRVLAQYESGRSDSGTWPTSALGGALDGVTGARWADSRDSGVRAVLTARVSLAKSKGCDGVLWARVDQDREAASGFPLTFGDTTTFATVLANAAHTAGLAAFVTDNAEADRASALATMFDGMLAERCLGVAACAGVTTYTSANKVVVLVEYSDEGAGKTTAACAQAQAAKVDLIYKSAALAALPLDACTTSPAAGYWQSSTPRGQHAALVLAGQALLVGDGDACDPGTGVGRCQDSRQCDSRIPGYKSWPRVDACLKYAVATTMCCAPMEGASGGSTPTTPTTPTTGFAALPSNEPECNPGNGVGRCTYKAACDAVDGFEQFSSVAPCNENPAAAYMCCAPKDAGPTDTGSDGPTLTGRCAAYSGLIFPLASGSLSEISANWGFSRQSGRRCHAGIDIYTGGARRVVAVADGEVVARVPGWYSCRKGSIDAIFVYHSSGPLAGKTINYGEVDPGTYSQRVGSKVKQGDSLGVASRCNMLHFELYSGRRTQNYRWYPASGRVGAGCHKTSLRTKPSQLDDPRPILDCLKPRNARFRHGAAFVDDAGDSELFQADALEDPEPDATEDALSGGAIAGIVIAGVVLLIAIVAVVLLMRRRRSASRHMQHHDGGGASIEFTSADAPAAGGLYTCAQCGKSYDDADQLGAHAAMRH